MMEEECQDNGDTFDDAERVYLEMRKCCANIYLYGNCRDSFPAMFVARRYSAHPILETPPSSLEAGALHRNLPWLVLKVLEWWFSSPLFKPYFFDPLKAPEDSLLHDQKRFPSRSLGDLKGILETVKPLDAKPHRLIFLANTGNTSSPPEDIKEVACACRTVESGCEAHVIDVDTARYPNIHPHNVQSGEDLPTIDHVEEIIFLDNYQLLFCFLKKLDDSSF